MKIKMRFAAADSLHMGVALWRRAAEWDYVGPL